MSKQVRWGVLGNATIARICVIPAIQKSNNSTVWALASRHPDTAQAIVEQHNIPHLFSDYETILADPTIDAVYIPLPNHLHHPWTLKAIAAGKHVLCEKPLALNAQQAQEMAAAAQEAGVHLMEAFMYRFHPRSRRLQELVQTGAIGQPRHIRTAFTFHLDQQELARGDNIRLQPEMGGGALLDVGCYGVSVARWLLGSEPTHMQAQAIYHPSGVDVQFVAILHFPGNVLATIEASFISALQQTLTVVGSQATIELPHDAFIPWEKETTYTFRQQNEETGLVHSSPPADEYQLMVEHFAEAVLGNTPLRYPPHDSISNMQVLDKLAETAVIHPPLKGPSMTPETLRQQYAAGQRDFPNLNLSGADLSHIVLSGANLSGADLSDANLSQAKLDNCDLSQSNLSQAILETADLTQANLSHTNFSQAQLKGAILSRTNLTEANLRGSDLSWADLGMANLSNCDLRDANMNMAIILRTRFRNTLMPDGSTR